MPVCVHQLPCGVVIQRAAVGAFVPERVAGTVSRAVDDFVDGVGAKRGAVFKLDGAVGVVFCDDGLPDEAGRWFVGVFGAVATAARVVDWQLGGLHELVVDVVAGGRVADGKDALATVDVGGTVVFRVDDAVGELLSVGCEAVDIGDLGEDERLSETIG